MNSVVVLGAFLVCMGSVLTQGPPGSTCNDNLDTNRWVWKGNFARRKNDCNEIFHCSNGEPRSLGVCGQNDPSVYYSIETGTCAFSGEFMKNYYGAGNCREEEQKYDRVLPNHITERRRAACEKMVAFYGSGPDVKRLHSGDPQNCQGYFNCQTNVGSDWFHNCPDGLYFNEAEGVCNLPERDQNRCNNVNFRYA